MTLHFPGVHFTPANQHNWNESAEQEKQFNILFVGVGVTTSGSVTIKQNGENRIRTGTVTGMITGAKKKARNTKAGQMSRINKSSKRC